MTSLELLKEIEAWLCFNTEPSREEIAKLRKSINDHLAEQLNLPPVIGRSEQFICPDCKKSKREYRDGLCEMCHKWHTS